MYKLVKDKKLFQTCIANQLKQSPIKLNEDQAQKVKDKLAKAVANETVLPDDHKYWEMLQDTKDFQARYELMNTRNPEINTTNIKFAATGWEANVNLPYDHEMVARKKLEESPGFAKFQNNSSGAENPLGEQPKIQQELQKEQQNKLQDLNYLLEHPTAIPRFLSQLKNEIYQTESRYSKLLDDPTDLKKMKVLIYIKEQTKKNFLRQFIQKKRVIDGHHGHQNIDADLEQVIEYFNREQIQEQNLLKTLKHKVVESIATEKESLLFNLLENKQEKSPIDLKYLINLSQSLQKGHTLTEQEQKDMSDLEHQLSVNVEKELEALVAYVNSKDPSSSTLVLTKEAEEFRELLDYNIDDDQLIEYIFRYNQSQDNEEQAFMFLQMIAHSLGITQDADIQQINTVCERNTKRILESSILSQDDKDLLLFYQQRAATHLNSTQELRSKQQQQQRHYTHHQLQEDLYPYDGQLKSFTSKFKNVDEKSFLNQDKFDLRNLNDNKYRVKTSYQAIDASEPNQAKDILYKLTSADDKNGGMIEFNMARNDQLAQARKHHEEQKAEKNQTISTETAGQLAMGLGFLALLL